MTFLETVLALAIIQEATESCILGGALHHAEYAIMHARNALCDDYPQANLNAAAFQLYHRRVCKRG